MTWLAVEKPGAKIRSIASSSDMAAIAASGADVALAGDVADPGHVDPAAVVLDLDHHVLALARRPQMDRRRGRLAERGPLRCVLQPVIQAVAQDMKQGLGDRLDDRLVGLGRGAFDHEARRLAERGGHFPDEAGEALEGVLQAAAPAG